MTEKLLQMMQEKGYFNQHKKVLVAVSGGADSMSLLHFLYNHQKDKNQYQLKILKLVFLIDQLILFFHYF